jgi:hypothetical protein
MNLFPEGENAPLTHPLSPPPSYYEGGGNRGRVIKDGHSEIFEIPHFVRYRLFGPTVIKPERSGGPVQRVWSEASLNAVSGNPPLVGQKDIKRK